MIKKLLCAGLLMTVVQLQANAYQPVLGDYAFKAELSPADAKLRRVNLPGEMLMVLTRSDLGDVAVFDQHGEPVPSWVRLRQKDSSRQSMPLSFNEFTDKHSQRGGRETVTVTRDEDGHLKSYDKEVKPQQQEEVITHYIIELVQDDSDIRIDEIRIEWTQEPKRRLFSVRLQASDDLNNWTVLRSRQSLAQLESNKDHVRGQTIKINTRKKYLQLSLNERLEKFELKTVKGYYNVVGTLPTQWMSAGPMTVDPKEPDYLSFALDTAVRPHSVRFSFTTANQLVEGDIYSQEPMKKRHLRKRGVVQHNIVNSSSIEANKPIKLHSSREARWWFKPTQAMASPPGIELAMPNYELLFIANDSGPYSITWGNITAGAPANALKKIIDKNQLSNPQVPLVKLGTTTTAGGADRLQAERTWPILRWSFWALLIGVVVITGRMAIGLYKEMNKQGE